MACERQRVPTARVTGALLAASVHRRLICEPNAGGCGDSAEILAEAEETDADLVMGRDSFTRMEDANVGDESTAARVRARSGRAVLLLPSEDTASDEQSVAETFAHAAAEDAFR